MKKLIQYIEILLASVLFINFSSADDLSVLKDLLNKSNSHGGMIKTIKMDVSEIKTIAGKPPLRKKIKVIYRKKDNHWRGEYERQSFLQENDSGKERVIHEVGVLEQIEDDTLTFHTKINSGVIEKKLMQGFGGIIIHGLSGISPEQSLDYNSIINDIKEKKREIKSISDILYEGQAAREVILGNEAERIKLIFVPAQQYSLTVCEAELKDPDYPLVHKTHVKMEKESSTGIWFPEKAQIEMLSKGSIQWTETVEYRNVILNQPITDDEISFRIPKGARLTSDISKETYRLEKSATLEDVLSGRVKSIQQADRVELTPTASARLWWRFIKMSLVFRILFILTLTAILYLIFRLAAKKIFTQKKHL